MVSASGFCRCSLQFRIDTPLSCWHNIAEMWAGAVLADVLTFHTTAYLSLSPVAVVLRYDRETSSVKGDGVFGNIRAKSEGCIILAPRYSINSFERCPKRTMRRSSMQWFFLMPYSDKSMRSPQVASSHPHFLLSIESSLAKPRIISSAQSV